MFRASSRRSIRLHSSQNGRCINVVEISKVRMSRYLDKLDNSSMLLRHQMETKLNLYAENTRYLEMKKKIVQKGGSKAMHDLALSRT